MENIILENRKELGLNKTESIILIALTEEKKGLSVKELVGVTQKDRTTVQKILIKLSKQDLVMKRQINLDRGFMFVYFSIDLENILDTIENNLQQKLNIFRSQRSLLNK